MTQLHYRNLIIFVLFDYLMSQAALNTSLILDTSSKSKHTTYLIVFISGLLGPLGFAPFHMPGMTLISLALFYSSLLNCSTNEFHQDIKPRAFWKSREGYYLGFIFGLGYFGFGVSWVIVSIHDYGGLNYFLSGMATLAFIAYLALFPTSVSYCFGILKVKNNTAINMLLFSVLWCLSEFIRASLFSGFPWLLIGTSQIDTPLKFLFPVIGIYGVGLLCSFACTLLATSIRDQSIKRYLYLALFVLIMITPTTLKNISWTTVKNEPISIGVVQANLAMRDKWDENLFWSLLKYYEETIDKLLGTQLIILPESAIPLPASYLNDYLLKLNDKTTQANSALMLGILQPTNDSEVNYYNSIISLGRAHGEHIKRRLVPFGEYIPQPFIAINRWLNLPEPNILPGAKESSLIEIANHPIASLICYEIAYPNLLRLQMPLGEWIVSISDNGWFGHSLASYQQLQMSQVLAALTGRFHIVVNNDGLSSIINTSGDIVTSLPPFSAGILKGELFPAQGTTPWIIWYNYPSIVFCFIVIFFILFLRLRRVLKQ